MKILNYHFNYCETFIFRKYKIIKTEILCVQVRFNVLKMLKFVIQSLNHKSVQLIICIAISQMSSSNPVLGHKNKMLSHRKILQMLFSIKI